MHSRAVTPRDGRTASRPRCSFALVCIVSAGSLLGLWRPPAAVAAPVSGTLACAADTGSKGKKFTGDLKGHNFASEPSGSLVGVDFSNQDLSGAIFSGQDLTKAKFAGAILGPASGPVDFTKAILTDTCFIGANLDQTDFSYAAITCADFSGTSLINAFFGSEQNILKRDGCRTKFIGATLDVRLISTSNWGKSDFTGAKFQNLSSAAFNLKSKDITGAILADTNFTGIDMTGANLTNVDFSRATLTNAVLNNAAVNGANFYNVQAQSSHFVCSQGYGTAGPRLKLDGSPCPAAPDSSEKTKPVDFTLAALKNADFTAATMDHAILVNANLTNAYFDNASLTQAHLQAGTDRGPATVQYASFTDVDFTNAQLSGVDFTGATLTRAIFKATTLSGTIFTNARMAGASFGKSTLQSVNFSGAILQSASFADATISSDQGLRSNTNFSCTQLGGADFTNAKITNTNFSDAVMPAANGANGDCCKPKDGFSWCGNIDAPPGKPYGPVTFPVLSDIVTCPNGATTKCTGLQWQLPKWTASCGGPPEIRWSRPNCDGGDSGPKVDIKDANLKSCILANAKLPVHSDVPLAVAQHMTQLNCAGRSISDIAGLENFICLTKLDLSSNALTIFTLAFKSDCPSLKDAPLQHLNLDSNSLTTLDLTAHPRLVWLNVANNKLKSIALSARSYLAVLDASHNQLASFNLPTQTSLATADLSDNLLKDVLDPANPTADLGQLTGLNLLDLSHNKFLNTMGPISAIAANDITRQGSLTSLYLACNPDFRCGTLGIDGGSQYRAVPTSQCFSYDAIKSKWTPLTNPTCQQ